MYMLQIGNLKLMWKLCLRPFRSRPPAIGKLVDFNTSLNTRRKYDLYNTKPQHNNHHDAESHLIKGTT